MSEKVPDQRRSSSDRRWRTPGGPCATGRVRVAATDSGQASVEAVAIAPLVGLALTALVVGLRGHRAGEAAGLAAHAAGLAAMQGRDPEDAARAAVPDVDHDDLRVRVDGPVVVVRVRAEGPRALTSRFDAERRVVARKQGETR